MMNDWSYHQWTYRLGTGLCSLTIIYLWILWYYHQIWDRWWIIEFERTQWLWVSMDWFFRLLCIQYTVHPKYYMYGLCFVVFCCGKILPIFFKVTSLALGQSYDCPRASEATLKNMSKYAAYECTKNYEITTTKQSTTKWWAYLMGYTLIYLNRNIVMLMKFS